MFEYTIVEKKFSDRAEELRFLCQKGKEGWELVQVESYSQVKSSSYYYVTHWFKRKVNDTATNKS